MEPEFVILEHPSDLGVEARGATRAGAFAQAAAGLMSVLLDPATVLPREERRIDLAAPDVEQLLVRWLSEILYLFDGTGFASALFDIHTLSSTHLAATVRGEPFSERRHTSRMDVKAVTYHQISVVEHEGATIVRVYLDI